MVTRTEYEQQIETGAEQRKQAEEILAGWSGVMETMRQVSGAYFRSRSEGKTYKRNPAHKIRLLCDNMYSLEIYPGRSITGKRRCRTVTVSWADINLLMHRGLDRILTVQLRPNRAPRLARYEIRTVDENVDRLIDSVLSFLRFPEQVIARSGDRCVFCHKVLTDPSSQLRGIGPCCFRYYGDFIRFLRDLQDEDRRDDIDPLGESVN